LQISDKTGGTVIGFKDNVKGLIPNPDQETLVGPKDTVVVLGGDDHIEKLKKHFLK
jgi:K+/H+ antiporter YhaU regulatory subunit KhtT